MKTGWENDDGRFFIMAGNSVGKLINYSETGHGLGTDFTGQLELGRVDYTGNPFDFDPSLHLEGLRDKFYFGVLNLGLATSTSYVDNRQNKVWSTSISLGIGASVFGPISTGVNTGRIILKGK